MSQFKWARVAVLSLCWVNLNISPTPANEPANEAAPKPEAPIEAPKPETPKAEAPKPEPAPAAPASPVVVTSTPLAPDVDYSKGVLRGKVVNAEGKPVSDATVALLDTGSKVVDWTKTNAQGEYAIAADPLTVLRLRPSKRGGILSSLLKTVGKVAAAPVKAVGEVAEATVDVAKAIDPIQTVKATALTAATGIPAPVAAAVTPKSTEAVKQQAELKASESVAKVLMGERQAQPKAKRKEMVPGEVQIAVTARQHKDFKDKCGAFWLEPATKGDAKNADAKNADAKNADAKTIGAQAWLETVRLASVEGDKQSEVENIAVLLSEPKLEPSLVPQGATVKLSAKLQAPTGPDGKPLDVRVFAREDKKRKVVELKAQQNSVFAGELTLDPATPVGNTVISIVALRAEPVEISLRGKKEDPLLDFASRLEDLDADKPYDFDPRIMASENRLDLVLTVLDPKKATPTTSTNAPAQPTQPATPATR